MAISQADNQAIEILCYGLYVKHVVPPSADQQLEQGKKLYCGDVTIDGTTYIVTKLPSGRFIAFAATNIKCKECDQPIGKVNQKLSAQINDGLKKYKLSTQPQDKVTQTPQE